MIPDAPPWIIIFAMGLLGMKFISEKYQIQLLNRKITATLSVFLFLILMMQYRSLFIQEASTALLIGLTALKIMDYKEERDLRFLFLLGFILVSLKPLYNIDFYWLLPTMLCFVGLWSALLQTYASNVILSKNRFLMQIFVRALPMTVILFLVFPRIVVPWAQAKAENHGQMGFSDELNPGQISELVSSRNLVFRAHFLDNIELKNKALYWRGAVLNRSLGLEWRSGKHFPTVAASNTKKVGIRYEIILEPTGSNYLFSLEKAYELSPTNGSTLQTEDNVFKIISMKQGKAISYEGSSGPLGHHDDEPSEETLQRPRIPEKTAKWIERVNDIAKTPEEKLKQIEKLFSDGSFAYSLKPGYYNADDMDDFLFKRRKGFCEHFAGAYATLARALGVPSRVVTGFQGGLYNRFGGFWRVTTHDSHAWVEVYLNKQWERIDPTEWIAPLRLEIGADAFFDIPEEERLKIAPGQYQTFKDSFFSKWADFATNQIEFFNYRWTQFLLDFDKDSQSSLIADLKQKWAWVLMISLSILALIPIIVKGLEAKPKKTQQLSELYLELINWAQKYELIHLKSETPLQFSERIAQSYPMLQDYLRKLDHLYVMVIYRGGEVTAPQIHELKNHWKTVKRQKP